jgi:hypothetical protein
LGNPEKPARASRPITLRDVPLYIELEPAVQIRQILGLPETWTTRQVVTLAQYFTLVSAIGVDRFSYWVSAGVVEVRG